MQDGPIAGSVTAWATAPQSTTDRWVVRSRPSGRSRSSATPRAKAPVEGLSSEVSGDVASSESATLQDATVLRESDVAGTFDCTNLTVNGQGLGAYSPTDDDH
jgi:hypothetical protein